MSEKPPVKTPSSLDPTALSKLIKQRGPAPVHLWDPPDCGPMDIRIASDGSWFHLGDPIRRPALVRLFSSILKREGDDYYLVTPVEKVSIKVDDCPFVANSLEVKGTGDAQILQFTLNTDEIVAADSDHQIIVTERQNRAGPHPILQVRAGLNALLSRNVFYQLVEMSQQQKYSGGTRSVVRSNQCLFELGSF